MGARLSYMVLLYLQTSTLWEKYKESIKKVKIYLIHFEVVLNAL